MIAQTLAWALAVVVLAGCAPSRPSAIQMAYDACSAGAKPKAGQTDDNEIAKLLTLDDNGHRMTIGPDRDGTKNSGANRTNVAVDCALGELDAPDALKSAVKSVTPTMGRQYTTWGDYRVTYSSTAADGLHAVITDGFA
jgi:hypothetical protein